MLLDKIFLYGTLCYEPLLELVSGCDPARMSPQKATLRGLDIRWAAGRNFPVPVESTTGAARGIVITASEHARARMDFYERAFGYLLHDVMVSTDGGEVAARVYLPGRSDIAPGPPWSLEDWVRQWGALAVAAAEEVMSAFGQEKPEAVGARFGSILSRAQSRLRAGRASKGDLRRGPSRDRVVLTSEETLSNDFFKVRALTLRHPTFAGGMTPELRREVFDAVDAVTVLPYDPVRDRVLLIEQFRAANYARGDAWPWSVEAIAGRCDPGESFQQAAHRETREEGGVELSALHRIGAFYPSTGALTEYLVSYIGIADLPDTVEGLAGLAEEGEDIRVFLLPFETAMARLDDGDIENATLMISLLQLARMRDGLRQAADGAGGNA